VPRVGGEIGYRARAQAVPLFVDAIELRWVVLVNWKKGALRLEKFLVVMLVDSARQHNP
jgi:hypothetical protein